MRTFDWLKKVELVEMKYCHFKEDPVRPELDNKFRIIIKTKIEMRTTIIFIETNNNDFE